MDIDTWAQGFKSNNQPWKHESHTKIKHFSGSPSPLMNRHGYGWHLHTFRCQTRSRGVCWIPSLCRWKWISFYLFCHLHRRIFGVTDSYAARPGKQTTHATFTDVMDVDNKSRLCLPGVCCQFSLCTVAEQLPDRSDWARPPPTAGAAQGPLAWTWTNSNYYWFCPTCTHIYTNNFYRNPRSSVCCLSSSWGPVQFGVRVRLRAE